MVHFISSYFLKFGFYFEQNGDPLEGFEQRSNRWKDMFLNLWLFCREDLVNEQWQKQECLLGNYNPGTHDSGSILHGSNSSSQGPQRKQIALLK